MHARVSTRRLTTQQGKAADQTTSTIQQSPSVSFLQGPGATCHLLNAPNHHTHTWPYPSTISLALPQDVEEARCVVVRLRPHDFDDHDESD